MSDEAVLNEVAKGLTRPHSRGVFLKLAAAAGASLTVPGAALAGRSRSVKRGLVVDQVPTLANSFYASWGNGYASSAKALGLKTKSYFPNFQATQELAQARGLKSQGASMLVGIAGDQSRVPQIARLCEQQGVYYNPCFENPAWFTPQDVGDHYVAHVTPRSEDAAYQTAKYLFQQVGGEGQVIHIQGQPGPTDSFRTLGVQRAAKEFPNVELVGNQPTEWTLAGGRKTMLNLVSAFPNAKGVFAQNDSIALGVVSVLEERRMRDVKVVGMDAIPEILGKLEKGPNFIGSFNALGYWIAGFAVVNVFDALNGWKPSTPERLLAAGGVLITPKNVATLRKRVYEAKAPFNWTKMSRTLNPRNWDPQMDVQPFDPNVFWKAFEKDRPLNEAWQGQTAAIKRAQRLYAAHYKTGPVKGLK
jgi:ribose transport system substrate-binding protein